MSSTGFFDLGDSKTVTVTCAGNLTVRGDVGVSVRYKSDSGAPISVSNQQINASGNLKLMLPKDAELKIEHVGGNVTIKGVQSAIVVDGTVAGNLTVSSVDADVLVHDVRGNARFSQVSGEVTLKGSVNGNGVLKHVGSAIVGDVMGDLTVKHITGSLSAQSVRGNSGVRFVTEDVSIASVAGDLIMSDIGGAVDVTSRDDIRYSGALAPGKHSFVAASTIDFRYPGESAITIFATTEIFESRIEFESVEDNEDGSIVAIKGDGGPMVTLVAPERLRIRTYEDTSDGFNVHADIDLDFADLEMDLSDLGERISAELNERMAEISTRIGPEIGLKAEQALRSAQAAVERAAAKVEVEVRRAEQRGRTAPKPRAKPRPAAAPVPPVPPKVDNTEAQLKILKMLEEGKVTVDEANKLLAALG